MPEKPILRSQRQQRDTANPPSRKNQEKSPPQKTTPSVEGDAQDVPLMFQAQIKDRGNIQFVGEGKSNQKPKYEQWVDQWLEGCPPKPGPVDESLPKWKRQLAPKIVVKLPTFGADVQTWPYKIQWRMVTNGGQDEGIIRPVLGAKGMPFFPGSSMKGAFRRVCPADKLHYYCGGEVETTEGVKKTQPGILRFHGGYPTTMDWAQANRLVDIAHPQQPYQVMQSQKGQGENANVQISLYQPEFRFGISSTQLLDKKEWEAIQKIWEQALGRGIGSRVSAGYGYVDGITPEAGRILRSVHLNGEGLMSQLLLKQSRKDEYKTPEFRANMFKAALRGHTLRLLGGLVDEGSAKALTRQIWGGIPEQGEAGDAVVGKVGVHFRVDGEGKLSQGIHTYQDFNKRNKLVTINMPTYELKGGRLDLLKMGEVSPELDEFLRGLVQFSLLLGGFGKSWRRVHHDRFHKNYFSTNRKPMIGCHWEFADGSQNLCVTDQLDLHQISTFITAFRASAARWIETQSERPLDESYAKNWREAWHPEKVQVWGRVAKGGKSLAVKWFHDEKRLKNTNLAGQMGQIGRVWHRMYPVGQGYMEFLTLFPDQSQKTTDFLNFLRDESSFERI